ncbi:MAG: S-ribosylhomocysteine lyase [Prevotella sp.]|uniref:S-ribosylhomocysteine lyase n=1 Tax=Prevotella sp. TaxID=59823 RepID=UPI002A2E4E96|nr:S-ribosylhomocysteine lyase [Prevotella sp.]MDD7317379.1 S-ribosylhomocysteine lyase [Prevotellaceae bacterium]MDY4019477.1 S-ribosylhomocysteine lyase [Prevotella sp.]
MEKIPSFTINHECLLRGIYVSRKDRVGGETVTTFDIRMKEPNREPVLHNGAIHTIEHLAATFLRNDEQWKDKIVYWGPMGCLTGNYLLMKGDLEPRDILDLMRRTFRFVADYEGDIPGASPRDCGNWLLQDLPMARYEARKYLEEVLEQAGEENLKYPG